MDLCDDSVIDPNNIYGEKHIFHPEARVDIFLREDKKHAVVGVEFNSV